ncbi:acyl-CoA N-acyltransferase [Stereum hirsutum FP-91666 SS1]|uniref:acyl-CoA N-acyltransferase n=1 Tax=Stereum hirsutum (strain FP-91666) TaxID=721885 RepID=UPI000440D055|nr:acyl-CoA N-acyltransferase [Stereum hirsutum FP-91666 SS1]EIM88559.1 acyl-CoA N-acyltransferase [Stereum hirsutum FP-91666 SS1]
MIAFASAHVQTTPEISSARSLHYSPPPTSFVSTISKVMTSLPSTASASISLRPATPRDIPALTEIYNHEIIHTSSLFNYDPVTEADRLKWLETTQAGGYPVLVAVHRDADRGEDRGDDGERTVGFCSLGALIAKAGYRKSAEISLYLHKDFRGRGLGKILYEAILEEARKKDIHAIFGASESPSPS